MENAKMTKTNIKIFKEITLSEKFNIEEVNQHLSIVKNEVIHSLKKVITKNIDKIIYAFAKNLTKKDQKPLAEKIKEIVKHYRNKPEDNINRIIFDIKTSNYDKLNPKVPALFDETFTVRTKVALFHEDGSQYTFDIKTSVTLNVVNKLQLNHEVSIDNDISEYIDTNNVVQNIVKKLPKSAEYEVKNYLSVNLTYFLSLFFLYVRNHAYDGMKSRIDMDLKYTTQKIHGDIPLPNQAKNIISIGAIYFHLHGVNILPVLEEVSILDELPNLANELKDISFNSRPAIIKDIRLVGLLYREIVSLINTNNNGIYLYIPNFIHQVTQERHKACITYLDFNPDINTINRLHLTYLSYNSLDEISEVSGNKGKLYNVSIGNESSLAEINRFVNKGSEVYQITTIPKTVEEVSL